jgi:hypothetical protein
MVTPGRVLEARDGVDELRRAAVPRQAVERRLQDVEAHAVRVHLDLHHVGLVGREGGDRAGIGRRLGDDDVARVDQGLADEVDDLLAARGDQDVVRVDLGVLGGHDLHDRVADGADPLRGAVLQRLRRGLGGHDAHDLRQVLRGERRGVGQARRPGR